jgi:hypothetical protein
MGFREAQAGAAKSRFGGCNRKYAAGIAR